MTDWNERDAKTRAERKELADLVERWGLPLPWGPYRGAVKSCFKCGERIVVYTWLGHTVRGSDVPPEPRPWTIREATTNQSGGMRYWVNHCPVKTCRKPQGDNYLYDEADASGPPPFRYTWQGDLPEVPGGPLPTPPAADPPGRPREALTLADAIDIMTGTGGRRGRR